MYPTEPELLLISWTVWEQKRVIISVLLYQQSRWWPWENKIISGKSENSFPEQKDLQTLCTNTNHGRLQKKANLGQLSNTTDYFFN